MPSGRSGATLPRPARETRYALKLLGSQWPSPDTELRYGNPFELLVATILSAQCTDERVNRVTPALFQRYADARALAGASNRSLEALIKSTGFFRSKTRALIGMATALMEHHAGEVPADLEALIALPGVGRKTANVVLAHALDVPALPVDRHVLRVANRLGIARSDEPDIVERQLCTALPRRAWVRASATLILHGRRVCKPRPLCERCAARSVCAYVRLRSAAPAVGRGGRSRRRRGAARRPTA